MLCSEHAAKLLLHVHPHPPGSVRTAKTPAQRQASPPLGNGWKSIQQIASCELADTLAFPQHMDSLQPCGWACQSKKWLRWDGSGRGLPLVSAKVDALLSVLLTMSYRTRRVRVAPKAIRYRIMTDFGMDSCIAASLLGACAHYPATNPPPVLLAPDAGQPDHPRGMRPPS